MHSLPLIVDLDGTLIYSDMLHESVLGTFRINPSAFLYLPYWLTRGKAALKNYLAKRTSLHIHSLPYNNDFLHWLKKQQAEGRKLILCTATHHSIAKAISEHLGIFDDVIASDESSNLAGKEKARKLIQRFGEGGFDYAGNSKIDMHVWKHARKAIIVNASSQLAEKTKEICEVENVFPPLRLNLKTCSKVLRIHQWLKNLLLFIPLLAAHQVTSFEHLKILIIAFFSFSLCASSVYIINDLLDLENDRMHPRKCQRPFASGRIPIWIGMMLAVALFFTSVALARYTSTAFMSWLLFYVIVTFLYSWKLKRLVLVDCLVLSMLYTLRIVAGSAAVGLPLSFWLLTFSVFLFLSLALIKRYSELQVQIENGSGMAHGRGYYTSDCPLIKMQGVTSGFAAALVLTLYIQSSSVVKLYKTPEFLWANVLILLFWINWMWLQTHRGKMHDDPLVYAVKDKVSLFAGCLFAIFLLAGSVCSI